MIIYGNTLATKNQRAQNIWITDAIRITEPMKAKLNCLENAPQERVGIKKFVSGQPHFPSKG